MRNNRTTLRILATVLVCFLFIGSLADAQSVTELEKAKDDAKKAVDAKKADHDFATSHLNKQIANFVRLHGHLVKVSFKFAPAKDTQKLIVAFTQIVEALIKSNILTSTMQKQLTAIETQRDKCNTIWADVVLAQTAYEDAIDAYNAAVSPGEQQTTVEVPQPSAVSKLHLCPGPCSTPFETQVLATTSHQVFCDVPPHKGSNYSYYSCPPDYQNECPQKVFHQAPCRGGCGTLFQIDLSRNSIPKDESHRTQCDERTS